MRPTLTLIAVAILTYASYRDRVQLAAAAADDWHELLRELDGGAQ